YLLFPPSAKRKQDWVEVGDISSLKLEQPEERTFHRIRKDGWKMISEKAAAWVIRTSDNEAIAYVPVCTHLGCAYRWDYDNAVFLCPCHTSTFSTTGEVLTGPAPRPLDRYQTRIEDGKLFLGSVQPPAQG